MPQIDIQMPVRRGGFVVSEVVERWLLQDADLSLYVDAGPDLVLEGTAKAVITESSTMTTINSIRVKPRHDLPTVHITN